MLRFMLRQFRTENNNTRGSIQRITYWSCRTLCLSLSGGIESWKGVLKKCCCSLDRNTTLPCLITMKPESPRFAADNVCFFLSIITIQAVLLPATNNTLRQSLRIGGVG